MSHPSRWNDRLEDAKPYVGPALATIIVVGVLAWFTWRQLTPLPAKNSRASAPPAEAAALEQAFERAVAAGVSSEELAAMLDRAIQQQRNALQQPAAPGDDPVARLARLEAARGSLRSRTARADSVRAEDQAKAAQAAGQAEDAVERLRVALRLQREANAALPVGTSKDEQREARLAAALQESEAEPLHVAVGVARTLGEAAIARERWAEAAEALAKARAKQAELNEKYPASRHASAAALEKLDIDIASLNATGLAAESHARERAGEQAATAGRWVEAAAAFEAALTAQRQIEEKFGRSRFTAPARIEQLAGRRDTVMSRPDLARAAELEREATQWLRSRQPAQAVARLLEASTLVEKTAAAYPRTRAVDSAWRGRLAYLVARRDDFTVIQETVLRRLSRVGGAQILNTEVTQELYSRVMGANPSRNAGRTLPVDSVSWTDAQEFCQRLGWILGTKVRLPSEAEFRAGVDRAAGEAEIWSAETANGRPREAAPAARPASAIFDVLGNVAEWLDAPAGSAAAPVAGGSYLDAAADLRRGPIVSADKRERARHIGFRVVVE